MRGSQELNLFTQQCTKGLVVSNEDSESRALNTRRGFALMCGGEEVEAFEHRKDCTTDISWLGSKFFLWMLAAWKLSCALILTSAKSNEPLKTYTTCALYQPIAPAVFFALTLKSSVVIVLQCSHP